MATAQRRVEDALGRQLTMEPQENPELLGQEGAERALLDGASSGRLAHAWLLTGPRGVGKATLAYRFARYLLASKGEGSGLFGDEPATLAMAPSDPVFRRVASGAHPDLRRIARGINPKTGKLRSEIVIDDIREAVAFLRLTPSEGGWRVVIVDGAEDMNRNAANALLKVLEEPPPQAVLLLVCHAPGRLLPTIRSRCRRLEVKSFPMATVLDLLARREPAMSEDDRQMVAGLAEGSIGRALALAEAGGVDLYRELSELLLPLPKLNASALHKLADKVARGSADGTFRIAAELLTAWLVRLQKLAAGSAGAESELVPGEAASMRRLAGAGPASRWIDFTETMQRHFALVEGLNLDRRQVWIATMLGLQRMATG
jgi:DNA polymerase-3 subunit delta'